MAYTPVAQRTKTAGSAPSLPSRTPVQKTGVRSYTPVAQRATTPPAPSPTVPKVPGLAPGHSVTIPKQGGFFAPKPAGEIYENVRLRDVVRELPDAVKETAENVYRGITESVTKPSKEQLEYEERFIPTPAPGAIEILTQPGRAAAKAISRFLNPGLKPLADTLAEIKVTNELVPLVEQGKMPASTFEELAVLHKTAPQIVGDVAQAVLTAYGGSQATKAITQGPVRAVMTGVKEGAKTGLSIGTLFGGAQALSAGTKDIDEAAQLVGGGALAGGVLGAITGGAVPVSREAFHAAQKAKAAYDKLPPQQKIGGYLGLPKRGAEGKPGEFYRGDGEGSMPKGKTAKDIVDYEQKELGNADVKAEPGVDLSTIKSDDLVWLTETKKQAEGYGPVSKVTLPADTYRIVARDADGGVLVQKNYRQEFSEAQKRTLAAFAKEPGQDLVGKVGDADLVLGAYGRNAVMRKLTEGKTDRVPIAKLPEAIENVREAYRAGDDGFRKDNIILIAKVGDETHAIVTRKNALGNEEVINYFKINSPGTYIPILKKFGVPDGNRTRIFRLEGRESSPLTYGDKSTIAKPSTEVKTTPQTETAVKLAERAKQFSTPEEFIESVGPALYHGTKNTEAVKQAIEAGRIRTSSKGNFGPGFYFGKTKEDVRHFAKEGGIVEFFGVDLNLHRLTPAESKQFGYKLDQEMAGVVAEEFKNEGFDGIVAPEGWGVIFPESVGKITTRDQLTKIWQETTQSAESVKIAQKGSSEKPEGEAGPIAVPTAEAVPEAIETAKKRAYTPVGERQSDVPQTIKEFDDLSAREQAIIFDRLPEELKSVIEARTIREEKALERYDELYGEEQERFFESLPEDLKTTVAEREMEKVYEEEIAPSRLENPLNNLADRLLTGRAKISVGTDAKTIRENLGKAMYMRVTLSKKALDNFHTAEAYKTHLLAKRGKTYVGRELDVDTLDGHLQQLREQGLDVTERDLVDALDKRAEERRQERVTLRDRRERALKVRAAERAQAKSVEEKAAFLRSIERDIVKDLLKKRYSIGERMKFEARAERRGIKKGIEKGLEGKAIIRQRELAKRQALREKIREITHTHSTRRAQVRAIADFFSLTDKELREVLGNRDYRIMGEYEYESFLKSLYGKSEEVRAKAEARQQLDQTIEAKKLYTERVPDEGGKVKKDMYANVDKLRRALKMPTIDNMNTAELVKFDEILSQYETGDVFLTTRQIETIDNTELTGIRTMREARERLAARMGIAPYQLSTVRLGELDHWRWDTALAEQSPYHRVLVEDTLRSQLEADMRYYTVDKEANTLIKKARASRKPTTVKERIKRILAPTDELIFDWLESTPEDKMSVERQMTKEELAAAKYVEARYAQMRDYLLKKRVIEHARSNYVTHIRRGFLEALTDERPRKQLTAEETLRLKSGRKIMFDRTRKKFPGLRSLVDALEEITEKKEQEAAIFNILDQDTGEILPLEKFFQFSMKRTGTLVPTKNVARAFLSYAQAFEKKRALDAIIPKLVIYTKAFTPKELTPRGLEFDRSLKRFFNEWINTKKGRTKSMLLKQGSNLDLMVRGGQAATRMIDLGFSIPGGLAAQLGEQTATYVNLGAKKYALGQLRAKTKRGREIAERYKNFTGKTPFDSITEATKGLTDKTWEAMFALYRDAYARANKHHLLGSLTPEEWKTGVVSKEKLAELTLEMGRYRAISGAESVHGATTEIGVLTQYKKWAIPALRTNLQNINKLARGIARKDPKIFQSREFWELFRVTQIGALVALMAYGLGNTDPKDKTFGAQMKRKIVSETLSLISAIDPQTLTGYARVAGFVHDLGKALSSLIKLEETKTTGELKGLNDLERILTPRLIKQFTGEGKPLTKTKSSGSIGGKGIGKLPGLPKLPALPGLPALPKL